MINIFQKIATGLIAVAISIGSFFGIAPQKEADFGAAIPTPVATFSTSLATELSSTDTTMTLTSGTTPDGTTLSGFYGFVIDSGTSSEEFITATCTITACTGLTRGVSTVTGNTSISALKHTHRKGASVKISDSPILLVMARIMNGDESFPNGMTITGFVTSSSGALWGDKIAYANTETITDDKDIPNKAYVDSAVVSGAANASLTAKGIAEEATAAEINAGTQAGGTSAELFVNPKYLKDSEYYTQRPTADEKAALAGTGTPSSGNKYVTADGLTAYQTTANLDTTTTLGTSATKYPSQNAVKTYVDTNIPAVTWKNGVFTQAMNDNTTKVIAHGLGRIPRFIKITGSVNASTNGEQHSFSSGTYNGTSHACVYRYFDTNGATGGSGASTSFTIFLSTTGDVTRLTGVVTFDATNITITWSGTSGAYTAGYMWEAF